MTQPSSRWKAFGGGGNWLDARGSKRRSESRSAPMPEAVTAASRGRGSYTCRGWRMNSGWLSRFAITRRDEQVEQDRAPAVFVHQPDLEREASWRRLSPRSAGKTWRRFGASPHTDDPRGPY